MQGVESIYVHSHQLSMLRLLHSRQQTSDFSETTSMREANFVHWRKEGRKEDIWIAKTFTSQNLPKWMISMHMCTETFQKDVTRRSKPLGACCNFSPVQLFMPPRMNWRTGHEILLRAQLPAAYMTRYKTLRYNLLFQGHAPLLMRSLTPPSGAVS